MVHEDPEQIVRIDLGQKAKGLDFGPGVERGALLLAGLGVRWQIELRRVRTQGENGELAIVCGRIARRGGETL